jgi:hypothetical protein
MAWANCSGKRAPRERPFTGTKALRPRFQAQKRRFKALLSFKNDLK